MRDPYTVLGVSQHASDSEIKQAYRKLAKQLHPDLNPDDPVVAERFKEVSAAYKILGDTDTRRKYDAGEIGPDGAPKSQFHYEYAGGGRGRGETGGFGFGGFDADDIFSEFFTNMRGPRRGGFRSEPQPTRGDDRRYKITVDFLDAAKGATRRINLPNGKMLDVRIPAGIEDGKQIRLKGQGHPGKNGGPDGDALIEVTVREHELFKRDGFDVHVDMPVTIIEAVLGAKIEVPTIDGKVAMTVPKGANAGRPLRLKGRGIRTGQGDERGDQYIRLSIMLPEKMDPDLEKLIGNWAKSNYYDVRGDLKTD